MKKFFTLTLALMASFSLWATDPYYASQDWGKDDFSSVVTSHTNVVISSSATAFGGNLSGKYYIQCGSSSGISSGYIRFAATQKIDSVSILFIGNSTSAAGISWCGWGEDVTPSTEVGNNYGSTETFAYTTKDYDNARWMTIDLSDKDLYTLQIFRQGKNLTNNGSAIGNFGANQTINILGMKVYLYSCTKPGDIANLSADESYNSADLSWDAAENSDGYKVYIEKKSDKTKILDWTDCATNSYSAKGLTAETAYTFKVRAKGADGFCDLGDQATVDFTTVVEPVLCPSGLSIDGTKEYMEHDNISLTAELTEGTGDITYQWYKGSIAEENAITGETAATLTISNCAKSDNGDYYCVAVKAECDSAKSTACAISVSDYICPTSGTIFSLAMKSGLSNYNVPHSTDLVLTSSYATIVNGSATLRNNHASSDDKARIYNSEVYFGGADAYLKLEMYCTLETGDTISITSTNYSSAEFLFTNTNNTSSKIESSGRKYIVKSDDLLNGKSTFYVWRNGANACVGTLKVGRPTGSGTALDNTADEAKAVKYFKNGQLFIEMNGKTYNAQGIEIR